jgi:hypothetical protein
MKKIRLDVDELEVSSFGTDDVPRPRGTVEGHEYTEYGEGCAYSNRGQRSCEDTCFLYSFEFPSCDQTGDTCGASCDWGC